MNAFQQAARATMMGAGKAVPRSSALRFQSTKAVDASAAASTLGKSSKQQSFNLLEWYSAKLDSHPLTTKCLTSGFIAGVGDFMCQGILASIDKEKKTDAGFLSWWDVARSGRFAVLGGALVGPAIHAWYNALSTFLPGTGIRTVIQRVVLDQFIFTPVFVPIWLASLWTLEGREWSISDFERELPIILPVNWCVWCPAIFFNFRYMPLKYQVLFSNFVSLFWNCFLSYTQAGGGEKEQVAIEQAAPVAV
mmetsp:Transcript_3938/g.5181  ORF Transcript_3938/g.5181 Transcript_3938/m.5181 type:complete len:250 (-) Transcript_3938:165-914(-)